MADRSKRNYEDFYEIIKVIGIGEYGCVYKGKDKETGESRAIKVIYIENIKEKLLSQYEREEMAEQLNLWFMYKWIYSRIWKYENMLN